MLFGSIHLFIKSNLVQSAFGWFWFTSVKRGILLCGKLEIQKQ